MPIDTEIAMLNLTNCILSELNHNLDSIQIVHTARQSTTSNKVKGGLDSYANK